MNPMSRLGRVAAMAVPSVTLALVFGVARTQPAIATIGHDAIRESDFQHYVDSAFQAERAAQIRLEPAARAQALRDYLDNVAIAERARRGGIDQDQRFTKAVELMEMKLLAQAMTDRHRESILQNSQVLPEELSEYYQLHQHDFLLEPRFTAHHLLVYVKGNPAFPDQGLPDDRARAKATEALTKLKRGESWQEVAKRYSDDVATRQRAGLIRDGQFGYRAPEVEQALRTQKLGMPGKLIKTVFGYYVFEVKERVVEPLPKAFEDVKGVLNEQLTQERSASARQRFMTPIWAEVGFRLTDVGKLDVSLLDELAVPPSAVLAEVAGRPIRESDFRWFCKDALLPSRRVSAYSRPGARQSMLSSFLDMLVLEAKARKDGLDKLPDFRQQRMAMRDMLLFEFVQERDQVGPAHQRGKSDDELAQAQRAYLDHLRAEARLMLSAPRK